MWFIQKMCILCLRNNVDLKSIYTRDADNIFIVEKLTYAIASLDNNLHNCPIFICKQCNKQLNNTYTFKQQCIKRFNYIANSISQLNPSNISISYLSVVLKKNSESAEVCTNSCNQNGAIDDSGNHNESNGNEEAKSDRNLKNAVNESNMDEFFGMQNIPLEIILEESETEFNREESNSDTSDFSGEGFEDYDYQKNTEKTTNAGSFESEVDKFENKQKLTTVHVGICKEEEQSHICEVCGKIIKKRKHLIRHLKIHSGEKPYKCSICQKAFSRVDNLNIHEKIHSKEKLYKCFLCQKTFRDVDYLNRHKKVHSGEKRYQCDICQKKFHQLCYLKRHNKVHLKRESFECNICSAVFIFKSRLRAHMTSIHAEEMPYQCSVCLNAFSEKSVFSSHKKIHRAEKPYQCDICLKTFHLKKQLNKHVVIHSTVEAI